MTNLDSVLKSRDITLLTKVYLVKVVVFPVVMYGCKSWTIRKAEFWRTDTFEPWCWRKLLRVPWTARRSNQSILKEISAEYSLEELILKLKLQYFGHLIRRADRLEMTDAGKDWSSEEKGTTEDEMVGWHHQLNGHECEQSPEVGEGQGGLACCSPWGHKESDTTGRLNWTVCWVMSDSYDPMDCSPPGSSVHAIFQARVLEWVAISSPRVPSQSRDQTYSTCVSCIAGRFFITESPGKSQYTPSFSPELHQMQFLIFWLAEQRSSSARAYGLSDSVVPTPAAVIF